MCLFYILDLLEGGAKKGVVFQGLMDDIILIATIRTTREG